MEQSTSQKVEAFTRLIERDYSEGSPFYSKFARIARQKYHSLIEQDIEDIYQDVLLRLTCKDSKGNYAIEKYSNDVNQEKKIDEDRNLKKWLLKCLMNECIDFLRSKKNTLSICESSPDFSPLSSDENPLELLIRREKQDVVRRELSRLYPIHQQVVKLVYFEGLKYQETAEILRIPLGTVKSRLHKALSLLGERMEYAA